MTRDYAGEMRQLVDAETGDGPYNSRIVAAHVVAKLRMTDPELLHGWLDAGAEHFLWQAVNDRDRSRRSHASQQVRRLAFRDAAAAHAAGDTEPLVRLLDIPFPVQDGNRKRLAELTAADLRYVATEYERRANENAMWAAVLRALAKRLRGGATVGERYTEEQIVQLLRRQRGEDV